MESLNYFLASDVFVKFDDTEASELFIFFSVRYVAVIFTFFSNQDKVLSSE